MAPLFSNVTATKLALSSYGASGSFVATTPKPNDSSSRNHATTASIHRSIYFPPQNESKTNPVMDEKHAPMPPPIRRGFSPIRLVLCMGYLALAGLTYWHFNTRTPLFQPDPFGHQQVATVATAKGLVPFEAHIMSKCPDAKDCLRQLVLPAMQKVHDKVNFTLSFIGRYAILSVPLTPLIPLPR